MDDQDFFVEQLSSNSYRVSHPSIIVTVTFDEPKDPDEATKILGEFFNSYGLLMKERDSNAKLVVAFGIVFNDLTERLGFTPDIIFDNDQGV
jgi:hypothetical protein